MAYLVLNVRQTLGRAATDMEYQMDNWMHRCWLSGDQLPEQAIHAVDAMIWGVGSNPTAVFGDGGNNMRPADSELFDHMSLVYEFEKGVRGLHMCRQYKGIARGSVRFIGTQGTLEVRPSPGSTRWIIRDLENQRKAVCNGKTTPDGKPNTNPYQAEHEVLLKAIVAGERITDTQEVADVSLACCMGREAVYQGQRLEFEAFKQVKQKLSPPAPLNNQTHRLERHRLLLFSRVGSTPALGAEKRKPHRHYLPFHHLPKLLLLRTAHQHQQRIQIHLQRYYLQPSVFARKSNWIHLHYRCTLRHHLPLFRH